MSEKIKIEDRLNGQITRLKDQMDRFEGMVTSLKISIEHSKRGCPIGRDLAQALVQEATRMAMTIAEHDAFLLMKIGNAK